MESDKKDCLDIDGTIVGESCPTYFIADIAANHDGSLHRAKELIFLAAESGADVAKFQHFTAETIVSKYGFDHLRSGSSHQNTWKKSVYEVYDDASVDFSWTEELVKTCKEAGITFFTSPYSLELVDLVDPFVSAFKIGSGDITWHDMISHIAKKGKPYLLATGAAEMWEVEQAVEVGLRINKQMALLQCNTNYSANLENFRFLQLRVLEEYRKRFPKLVLGLSDHTPGHSSVLGAVALGAKIIEKHFTDDIDRSGPDHKFAMDPSTWHEMVERTRELEYALGSRNKHVEENEFETVILQRRAIRAKKSLQIGMKLSAADVIMLRPCPSEALAPYELKNVIGKRLSRDIEEGDLVLWSDLT